MEHHPTRQFLMSWADLFSAAPKAKDHKGQERSASLQPQGRSQPPFSQRAELRSQIGSEVANSSCFPGKSLLWRPALAHRVSWRSSFSCSAGARAPGLFVFALAFLAVQEKCIRISSNRLSFPAALMLHRALSATVKLKWNVLCPLLGLFLIPLPICNFTLEKNPPLHSYAFCPFALAWPWCSTQFPPVFHHTEPCLDYRCSLLLQNHLKVQLRLEFHVPRLFSLLGEYFLRMVLFY